MDFRQLRHFLIVAEELHFGRAAARLGIAQPPLSQSIKRLEQDLGVELFNRSSRKVELSAAGRAFLPEVRGALAQLGAGARQAKRAASGELAELTVGFTSTGLYHALPNLIRRAREVLPAVEIKLVERSSAEQIAALKAGVLDIATVHQTPRGLDGLEWLTIERSQQMIAIPAAWPLANRASVRLADLADCPFIMPPLSHGTQSVVPLLAACEAAGFTPRVEQEAYQSSTMLSLCAAGFGVTFVPATAAMAATRGVAILPVDDMPESTEMEILAAWLPDGGSPALAVLIDALKERVEAAA